jgi:hypothetical protein
MIESTNELQQSVAINSNVLLSSDTLRTRNASCCGFLEHEEGSGLFTLTKNGIYEILFRANITSATANDVLGLVMTANGENLTGTQMDYTVATASVNQEVSATRLVRICNGSKTIAIKNNSTTNTTPMLVENANIIIKKLA